MEIKRILKVYEETSGQKVNFHKSSIAFTPNMDLYLRQLLQNALRVAGEMENMKYLELLSFVGKNKRKAFDYLRENMQKKLQLWKGKRFSIGGKEVLIKLVAQTIASFTMGVFQVSYRLCHELQSMVISWWWGAVGDERKIHWLSTERLFKPKKERGIGFKNLVTFNKAMMAKSCWRILTWTHSLAVRILKCKYFPNNSFLNVDKKCWVSYLWSSICWGRELLVNGIRRKVGNGTQIKMFKDPWAPWPFSYKPITTAFDDDLRVSELLHMNGGWDLNALSHLFLRMDVQLFFTIPLGFAEGDDILIWHFDSRGEYNIKSGY